VSSQKSAPIDPTGVLASPGSRGGDAPQEARRKPPRFRLRPGSSSDLPVRGLPDGGSPLDMVACTGPTAGAPVRRRGRRCLVGRRGRRVGRSADGTAGGHRFRPGRVPQAGVASLGRSPAGGSLRSDTDWWPHGRSSVECGSSTPSAALSNRVRRPASSGGPFRRRPSRRPCPPVRHPSPLAASPSGRQRALRAAAGPARQTGPHPRRADGTLTGSRFLASCPRPCRRRRADRRDRLTRDIRLARRKACPRRWSGGRGRCFGGPGSVCGGPD
jgi:hypothetical protein